MPHGVFGALRFLFAAAGQQHDALHAGRARERNEFVDVLDGARYGEVGRDPASLADLAAKSSSGADFKKRMVDLGITTSPVSQPAFAGFVKEQVTQLAATVKGAGVKL